jgi:methyl-accepting chemotaxis protein
MDQGQVFVRQMLTLFVGASVASAMAAYFVLSSVLPAEQMSAISTRLVLAILVPGAVGAYLLFNRLQFIGVAAQRLEEALRRMESGQFDGEVLGDLKGPMGNTLAALRRAMVRSRDVITHVEQGVEAQRRISARFGETFALLGEGSRTQIDGVTETSAAVNQSTASLREIADSVDTLAKSAEDSSSSVLEMVATSNEVAENIHNLAAAVEETTSSIEEMTYSIKEVAKNIEQLSTTAEETASSMSEMDVSISQVENNATETTKLSEQVMNDAEKGVQSINRTLTGIDKIKEFSQTGATVIGGLGEKILEIGNILNVIDDVAEQTNLLALNAAIIAAQAGEHGRGFAVVADEIKDLAERTGNSTKEIAALIKGVQDESKKAVNVMEQGVRNVEEGVRLGHEAEDALRKILESAQKSTLMVRAIASATLEQTKGSKQVTGAISRIAETVQQIALSTSEQANGSEQIMKSAERMKVITQHVERSSQEQNRGGKQVTQAIEKVSEMANQINRAQREQAKGNEQVLLAIERIRDVAERNQRMLRDFETTVTELNDRTDTLGSVVLKR